MHLETKNTLLNIGLQLDKGIYPRILNGGVVTPGNTPLVATSGEERVYEASRRPSAATTEGSPWREATTRGSGTTGETTPIVSTDVQATRDRALQAVDIAYPGTRIWRQENGLWLLIQSSVLSDLKKAATFLVGISYTTASVRGWGFWKDSYSGVTWIGPRHTNFPDGSICAYVPADVTWQFGDPIIDLIDLYTLWSLRHLFLETFGRWPGHQAAHHPYERILEFRGDELCGCGSEVIYENCCKQNDLSRNRLSDAVNFCIYSAGGLRSPPGVITQTVLGYNRAPSVDLVDAQ